MRGTFALMVAALVCAGSCSDARSLRGPGLHLQLRVRDAQLWSGGLGEDEGGPTVSQVQRPQPVVVRGDGTVQLAGRLGPGGVALHVQADGDADHWVVPAKGFDFVVSDELLYSTELEFSYAIQTPQLGVRLQAADESGRLGPVTETSFELAADVPPARLMVSLAWDAPADVDLHVMDADGVVIGSKNINSYEPPLGGLPNDEWMDGAYLDYDSNQHCDLDLRNRENVVWLARPPIAGTYRVFAHLHSPCETQAVNVVASVLLEGNEVARGYATLYAFDSRVHDSDAEAPGLRLLQFDVP